MRILFIATATLLTLCSTSAQAKTYRTTHVMAVSIAMNGSAHAGPFASIDKYCKPTSTAALTILQKPRNGALKLQFGAGDANFAATSRFAGCNELKTRGSFVSYYPRTGYRGSDIFRVLLSFEDGERRTVTFPVSVR